jgi:hypothetical protein
MCIGLNCLRDERALFKGLHVFIRIGNQRKHSHAANHRRKAQVADRQVLERKIVPDPALASIRLARPNRCFFLREIF